MTQVVLVVTLLAGAVVITMTCPPLAAVITVCGIVALSVVLAKATGKI
jgi:hypothetical protein